MRGVTPYRKVAILVLFFIGTAFVQVSYYSKAAAEFDSIQADMDAQATQIEAKKQQILSIRRAREAARATEELRNELRTRLAATPVLRTVVNDMELELATRGYEPPRYSPASIDDNVVDNGTNRYRLDGFDLSFQCNFTDLIELIERWERLPYGIRIEELSVQPSTGDLLEVDLTVRLRKLLGSDS